MKNQSTKYSGTAAPSAHAARLPFRQRWLHRALLATAASIVAVAPASLSAQADDCEHRTGILGDGYTADGIILGISAGSAYESITIECSPTLVGGDNVWDGKWSKGRNSGFRNTYTRFSIIEDLDGAGWKMLLRLRYGYRTQVPRPILECWVPARSGNYTVDSGWASTPYEAAEKLCNILASRSRGNGRGDRYSLTASFTFDGGALTETSTFDANAPICVTMECGGDNCFAVTPDTTPPVIDRCVDDSEVAYNGEPAVATGITEFNAQGGNFSDDTDDAEELIVEVIETATGSCPIIITREYTVTDLSGNTSESCVQTITVNNLFAEDAIIWHQPLARKGMSEDTDPSLGGPKKFKLGQTIPIKVHAVGCEGDITANSNVIGTVKVLGDTTAMMEGEDEFVIDYNGIGGGLAGEMVKIDGRLKYNLDTKSLKEIPDTKVYILQVTVSDTSTGESVTEELQLEAK